MPHTTSSNDKFHVDEFADIMVDDHARASKYLGGELCPKLSYTISKLMHMITQIMKKMMKIHAFLQNILSS